MTTQTEILERQEATTIKLEVLEQILRKFLHGTSLESITTESGQMPTLAALIEEIRQRAGYRRHEITYFVHDLLRYQQKAEPLFIVPAGRQLWFNPQLAGSYFRLQQGPSGAPITFELTLGGTVATITFAAGSTEGVVSGVAEMVSIPAGTPIQLQLVDSSLQARSLSMLILGLVEAP